MSIDRPSEVDQDELEAEREFLLKSLDDLDSELLAGNIDPDNYRVLHDDYTARAAAVIKSIDDGVNRKTPAEARRSTVMKYVTIFAVIVFCVLVAVLVAKTSGQRRSGETTTASRTPQTTVAPNTYEGHMQAAVAATNVGSYEVAIDEYSAAAKADPTQAEPLAQRGSLTAQVADTPVAASSRAELLVRAMADLNQAIKVDPSFVFSYAVKGAILERLEKKYAEAIPVLKEFLVRAPATDPDRPNVQTLLAEAQVNLNKSKKP